MGNYSWCYRSRKRRNSFLHFEKWACWGHQLWKIHRSEKERALWPRWGRVGRASLPNIG